MSSDESPMMRLSPSILREQVFSFLAYQELLPHGIDQKAFDVRLSTLRLVCRQWREVTESMSTFHRGRAIAVDFQHEEQRTAAWIQSKILIAEQIQLVLGKVKLRNAPMNSFGPPPPPSFARYPVVSNGDLIDWSSMLSGGSRVLRLDLTLTPRSQVGAILRAAASTCPHVKALLLPLEDSSQEEQGVSFLSDLRVALDAWYHSNGGLHQLRVPWLPEEETQDLLCEVVSSCPQIEYFQSYPPHGDRKSGDWSLGYRLFNVPIDSWKAFCAKCTSLRELDWSMVVPSKEYAHVFAARPWKNLTNLYIRFRNNMPDPQWQPCLKLTEFRSLIQATPALKSLELVFPVRHITEGQQFRCDEVLTDLATHCPQLEAIRLRPESNILTTIGWKALMPMPRLAHVDANKLEDATNTSLVDALRLCPMKVHRHIDLQILGLKHPVIWNMLRYLDSQESEHIQQLYLSIKLERDEFADGFPHFRLPAVSMRELDDTLARIQAKYGNSITRLHVLVKEAADNGVSGALFLGCELWINHVELGKGDKCKFDREIYRMTMG